MSKIVPDAYMENNDNFDALQAAADDPSKVHVIMQADRLGSKLFCVKLEYEHYQPRSGKNKLFDFHIVQWPFDEQNRPILLWFITGIPKGDFHIAESVATECGMALEKGSPFTMHGSKGQLIEERFPMQGPNCYVLKSSPSSIIYENDHEKIARQKEWEAAECDRIVQADEDNMREEFRQKGYTVEQINRILHHWNTDNPNYIEPPEGGVPDGQNRKLK